MKKYYFNCRTGQAQPRRRHLQPSRGVLHQPGTGEKERNHYQYGLQYDFGSNQGFCSRYDSWKKPENRYGAAGKGNQKPLFCYDAEAAYRLFEGCLQSVCHGSGKEREKEK